MKPHLYIMRTLKDKHKIERDGTPKPLKFDKFYERMAENMRKLQRGETKKLEDDEALRDVLVIRSKHDPTALTSKDALIKAAEFEQHLWMKRRKKEHKCDEPLIRTDMSDCISALFELMNTKKVESIEGVEFVSQLLSLGLSSDPRTLVRLLEMSFEEDIATLQLTRSDLLKFCKGTRRSDHILAVLTQMIQKSQPHTEEAALTSPRAAKSSFMPSLRDYMSLIHKLWDEFELDIRGLTRKEHIESKVTELHMVPDLFEAKKMMSLAPEWVSFEGFSALFARSILKGALIELDQKLGKMNPTTGNCSTALKISTYKRRLLLAGINSTRRNPKSHQQGATALRALEQFHVMQTAPLTPRRLPPVKTPQSQT